MRGENLDKKDFFGKSDPFVVISRLREDDSWVRAAKTEHIKRTLNPSWEMLDVTAGKLCNGDLERPLLFQVFDWNMSGNDELIGECQVWHAILQCVAHDWQRRHCVSYQKVERPNSRWFIQKRSRRRSGTRIRGS